MRPQDIQTIGHELAIKWADGSESFMPLERLRRACPCAGCKGEIDILGNLYKNPEKPYAANAFKLVKLASVGGYAIQPVWADGHNTGIFSFEYLRRVAGSEPGV
jgi:DUF971 family protein